jgi:hypothetical protein
VNQEFLKVPEQVAQMTTNGLTMTCPHCHHLGTFQSMQNFPDMSLGARGVGHRRCPHPSCRIHVFVVVSPSLGLICSYPPQLVSFDGAGVPSSVLAVFREALVNQANDCFVSAGMMIRKTLELLCDHQEASGGNLKDRIASLRSKVTLPEALLAGADNLRLLGNDAAHVEAKTYEEIGKEEIEVGVAVTMEILRAVYQHHSLVAKLQALKKKKDGT